MRSTATNSQEWLENLLTSWEIPELIERFKEQKLVSMQRITALTPEMIKELIPELGLRLDFQRKWKSTNDVNFAVVPSTSTEEFAPPSPKQAKLYDKNEPESKQWDQIIPSKYLTEKRAIIEIKKWDLKEILKIASVASKTAVQYYEYEGMLTTYHRKAITNVLANRMLAFNLRPSHDEFKLVANKICELFPSEKVGVYYSPPDSRHKSSWGKLPDRVKNIKFKVNKMNGASYGVSHLVINETRFQENEQITERLQRSQIEDDEDDPHALLACAWLQHFRDPWKDVLRHWALTVNQRFKCLWDGDEDFSISDYLKKWPVLQSPNALTLYCQDFNAIYPGKESIFKKKWETSKQFLIKLLKAEICSSDYYAWKWIQDIDNITGESSDAVLFSLLPSLCARKVGCRTLKGRKIRDRSPDDIRPPTIMEARNCFALHVKIPGTVDKEVAFLLNKLRKLKLEFKPLVIFVGHSLADIKACYVQVDKHRYPVKNPIEAVDTCFKAIHAINTKYSTPARSIWYFIQRYYYEINTTRDENLPHVTSLISSLAGLEAKQARDTT